MNEKWLQHNLTEYLYEVIHISQYTIEEIVEDILNMIEESKEKNNYESN